MKPTRRQVLGAGIAAALGTAAGVSNAAVAPRQPAVGTGEIASHLRLSLAAYSFRNLLPQGSKEGKMTLHDLLDLAAVWRIDALEPTSYYFSSEEPDYLYSLKAKAFKLGLDISGTAIRNNFCRPAGEPRDGELAHVRKWVDHAVAIGAPVIRVFAGSQNRRATPEQEFAWVVDGMKASCDYAGSRGVFLAIENHGYLTKTPDDVFRIVKAVDHEWFGVNLDTGNFDSEPYEGMARLAPEAINVQVKAAVPAAQGKEEADFGRIVQILRDVNYRGYLALEYEEEEDPMVAVPRYIEKLRAAIMT